MPTFKTRPRFRRDFEQLSADEKERFRQAVAKFVEDLERGGGFRSALRVKGIQGTQGIFEMTWAKDGRATFEYGAPVREGQVHVVWRRVGSHVIFSSP
jgi:muconolactone delta-isomerase